uniref:Uncharacterized protein n=1 Tax=Arundo donax TaxID=35708 RepID=A0A0A8ZX72_ARUDO
MFTVFVCMQTNYLTSLIIYALCEALKGSFLGHPNNARDLKKIPRATIRWDLHHHRNIKHLNILNISNGQH